MDILRVGNQRMVYLFTVLFLIFQLVGCATHSSTTTRTTSSTSDPDAVRTTSTTSVDGDRTVVTDERPVTDRTVVTEKNTTTEERDPGLGGPFHIVGEILALPFRLVGDLFDAIF